MKNCIALTLALLALTFTGCVTTPSGQKVPDPVLLNAISQEAAAVGSSIWLAQHPEDRNKFELSRTSLRALIAGGNGSPEDLRAALVGLPISQLQGQNGAVIVSSAVVLIDAAGRALTAADSKQIWPNYVLPIAQGLEAGLTQTLGN